MTDLFFFLQCFELWTHVSQHWPVSFVLIELPFYGNGKSYIFTVLTSTVCVVTYCECGLWCVSVCVHMCICIYHSRPVMLLFGGKATSIIKVSSKTACGFLDCRAGVGSHGKTKGNPKLTVFRHMDLNALSRSWPAIWLQLYMWGQGWPYLIDHWALYQAYMALKCMRSRTWL